MLGKTFENNFFTVSNEGEDHLWLYFIYFLNYAPVYEEIDCLNHRYFRNLKSTLSPSRSIVLIIYARCVICHFLQFRTITQVRMYVIHSSFLLFKYRKQYFKSVPVFNKCFILIILSVSFTI